MTNAQLESLQRLNLLLIGTKAAYQLSKTADAKVRQVMEDAGHPIPTLEEMRANVKKAEALLVELRDCQHPKMPELRRLWCQLRTL